MYGTRKSFIINNHLPQGLFYIPSCVCIGYFVMVAVEVAPSHATVPPSVSATKRTGM